MSLSIEPVPLNEVVRESLGLVRPLAAQRAIHLVTPELDPGWHALADRQRLKQVLLNLLSNAVKYNRPRGKVQLDCSRSDAGALVIEVADTGPGIPSDQMDRLFSPFERLGAEQTAVEGTGLGLALSKRLVEAMGGTIGVRSSEGAGSRFTIELAMVEGPLERLNRFQPPATESVAEAPQRRVLYVEDNLSNLKLIEHVLARRPEFTLDATMHGRLGVELAREHRPDLILLDLNLPDVSGREVLALLRDDHRTRDIPVVVITADATDDQAERLAKAGATAYLTKPLDIRRFFEVLDRTVAQGHSQESWPL